MTTLDGFILTRHYDRNVGASKLIANGIIELESALGVGVKRIEADAVVLNDHSRSRYLCHGYGLMRGWAAKLISQDVADKAGRSTIRARVKVCCAICGSQCSRTISGSTTVTRNSRCAIRCT